ncbi:hypothetical protein EIP91_003189 [Steccherinum ochraceum]|uniref:F-box domain-containing protein n=1 Tax=Steccherinum ochraceum TaxID=92696 RepID=A0A4R0RUT8_9APHY|nr:hypothetical protein EIP91_003189 [Steccherinum ochraceum]
MSSPVLLLPLVSVPPRTVNGSVGLPTELLNDTFRLLFDSSEHDSWFRMRAASQVCRYWRDIVLHTPYLWQDLHLRDATPLPAMHTQLVRAGSIPLNVAIDFPNIPDSHILTLAPELHRARSLHMISSDADPINWDHTYSTPLLQDLHVVFSEDVPYNAFGRSFPIIPLVSTNQPLRLLKHLTAHGVAYSSVSAFFRPTLRSLSIVFTRVIMSPTSHTTLASFLQALQGMPVLEELSVTGMIYPEAFVFIAAAFPAAFLPMVTLPSLRRIFLHCHGRAMVDFLHHLIVPARAFINRDLSPTFIAGGFPASSGLHPEQAIFPDAFAAVASKLAGDNVIQTESDVLPVTDELCIRAHDVQIVDIRASKGSIPFFSYQHRDVDVRDQDQDLLVYAAHLVCECIPAAPLLAGVRTLSLQSVHQPSPGACRHLFRTFPSLERLELDNCQGTFEELASAIDDGNDVALPFPHLQALSVTRIAFDQSTQFVAYLQFRRDAGHPLRTLKIRSCQNLVQEDVEVFQAHVGEVDWDEDRSR